ncbi:M42 family metallopeptidase [candidate division KSB1 bacterium]|nr:M42 family metallopeptidase [candidate division KSB1 bacterium]
MRAASLTFLKNLLDAPSPSGFEQPVAEVWRKYVHTFADAVERDYHGNSIASLNTSAKKRLMFAGHCDELGFLVHYINEQGFIYFKTVGGHDMTMISGRRVKILTKDGPVTGVTGKKAIHLMTPEERKKVPEIENLWIDIGSSSKKNAEKRVAIGDPVVYDMSFQHITKDVVTSRAFDNKVGAFAVAEALRYLQNESLQVAVYSVATVQEEIGLRGARTSAFGIAPDIGIGIDVTHATDHPEVDMRKTGEVKLGAGPVILRGANAHPKVAALLVQAAEEEKIPYQLQALAGGIPSDANELQLAGSGSAAGAVSIPLRYMHTPSEIVSLSDVDNTAKLLAAFAKRITADMDFRI